MVLITYLQYWFQHRHKLYLLNGNDVFFSRRFFIITFSSSSFIHRKFVHPSTQSHTDSRMDFRFLAYMSILVARTDGRVLRTNPFGSRVRVQRVRIYLLAKIIVHSLLHRQYIIESKSTISRRQSDIWI